MCVCVRESERERRIEKALIHSQHPLHVPYMSLTCPLHVPYMSLTCPLHVPYMCERRIEKALILVLYLAHCVRSFTRPAISFSYPYMYWIYSLYLVCASLRHTAVGEMQDLV